MKWNELPVLAKERIVSVYESAGLDAAALAAEQIDLDITTKSLQRRIQEHRKFVKGMFEDDLGHVVPEPASLPVHNNHPPSALTDLRYIDLDTDQGEWVRCLHQLASRKRVATVMHLADVHFPFQHGPALEVTYQLIEEAQPDIIVVGSDAFDFAMLSHFSHDADLNESEPDVLKEAERYWREFILRIRLVAPNAILVWIWGNHDQRLMKYLNDEAPKLRITTMEKFVEIVRCDGEVLYIGYTDYVRIGPLVVQHGYRTALNAAKNQLLDAGGQISTMAGHVHRTSEYEVRGEDFTVRSIVSGCLTNYPHYQKGRRQGAKWQLGTCVATVDFYSREVDFENLVYQMDDHSVWARFRGHVLSAEVPPPQNLVSVTAYLEMEA
jgi:hypothetical protein